MNARYFTNAMARHRIVVVPGAALIDILDERRDCVVMVRRGVERRPDGRRVVVVRRRGRVRVRQRVVVVVGRKVVIVMVVGVTVSEVSLELDAHRSDSLWVHC